MEIDDILARFKRVKRSGQGWSAACPSHSDHNNSLSIGIGDQGIVIKCHAGCDTGDVVKAVGLELGDLFPDEKNVSGTPPIQHARVHTLHETPQAKTAAGGLTVIRSGITLAEYSKAKALPIEFLADLGLRDRKHAGKPAVAIPYLSHDGRVITRRYRIAMAGDRFRWRSGAKPQLYGLWRLDQMRSAGFLAIVEGESDCHAAWYHGVPALGLPGAANWRDERDATHLDGIEVIYVVVERDTGGQAVLKWLATSKIKERVHLIDLGEHKDLSDLHIAAGENFEEVWKQAIAGAVPFSQLEVEQANQTYAQALDAAGGLIEEPDILAKFSEAITAAGVVGETTAAKLIYLALVSRHFTRPISIVIKGPSSAGKSFTTERVLAFFPEDAFYTLTAMSERALAYGDEPLEHRIIVIFEAAALESDFTSYLLRSLLSEGCIRYEFVEKTSEGMRPRLIERKGPTGCLVTTTAAQLHPENETRMLTVTISDSREQTRFIIDRLADETETNVDLEPWQALQTWLKGANHRVTIPFAKELGALVPEIAVRLRRDFHHVLTLVRAHALLHQVSREEDGKNRIIATLDDYAAIYDLVADIVAEGVEATVRPEVRQTVDAVKNLLSDGADSVTVKQVAARLDLDASTISRRTKVARSLGYLKNEETRRGSPAKLVIGDKMPADIEVLPHPDRLQERVHACTANGGDKAQTNNSEPMVEVAI